MIKYPQNLRSNFESCRIVSDNPQALLDGKLYAIMSRDPFHVQPSRKV